MPIGELNISRKNQYLSVETAKNIIKENYDFSLPTIKLMDPQGILKLKN